ncbi:DUF2291 domain-containing protein [Aurantimonas sp. A2-1-M11]|uniref:DUF2291 family protein n=1 Tax=Aurantimonas sp. A2-1-M11 TaxID=3113712 RepID=UPI002F92FC37
MRTRSARATILATSILCLSGFTIVWESERAEGEGPVVVATDETRMAAYAEEAWDPKVLPQIAEHEVPLADLRAAVARDAVAAGEQYGFPRDGETSPWNFAVSGEGTIVEAKLESRAAKLQLDTDADGKGDVTVQLGPIIRGTALRDAMPFIVFTDFRDQIEFAKLANALNAVAHSRLTIPEGDVVGQTARFEGVFALGRGIASIELVPTKLQIGE